MYFCTPPDGDNRTCKPGQSDWPEHNKLGKNKKSKTNNVCYQYPLIYVSFPVSVHFKEHMQQINGRVLDKAHRNP